MNLKMKPVHFVTSLLMVAVVVFLFTQKSDVKEILGTQASTQESSAFVQALFKKPSKSPFKLLYGDNVFLAPNDGSLTVFPVMDKDGGTTGETIEMIRSWVITKNFLTHHDDKYDFLVILAPTFESPGFDSNEIVTNDVQGIGRPIQDMTYMYGGKGKLKSVTTVYSVESYLSLFVHEISHTWLMYLSDSNLPINRDGAHWGSFVDTATREAGKLYYSPNGGKPYIDNGNGTFIFDSVSPVPENSWNKFNSMELYLMGFLPASKVTLLTVWKTDSTDISGVMTGTKYFLSVEDVIKIAGKRKPAYPYAQKNFNIAYIVVPRKGEAIDPAILQRVKVISEDLPKEWSFATGKLSTLK